MLDFYTPFTKELMALHRHELRAEADKYRMLQRGGPRLQGLQRAYGCLTDRWIKRLHLGFQERYCRLSLGAKKADFRLAAFYKERR